MLKMITIMITKKVINFLMYYDYLIMKEDALFAINFLKVQF